MAQHDNLARKDENEFEAANDANYGDSPIAQEVLKARQSTKTVQGDFESKGIAARAYQKREAREEEAANDATVITEATRQREEMLRRMAGAVQTQVRQTAMRQATAKIAAKAALAGATKSARWWLLGIMVTIYIWQFTLAVLSLVGFGGQAIVEGFLDDTWLGKAINFVAGWFIDFKSFIPFEYLAMSFWGVACLLTFATVIGLLIWFFLSGKSILHNTASTIISFVCISLNILPVTNLFPWLILWALYVEVAVPAKGSLFSTT